MEFDESFAPGSGFGGVSPVPGLLRIKIRAELSCQMARKLRCSGSTPLKKSELSSCQMGMQLGSDWTEARRRQLQPGSPPVSLCSIRLARFLALVSSPTYCLALGLLSTQPY